MDIFIQTLLSTIIILGIIVFGYFLIRLFSPELAERGIGCSASESSECDHCALSEFHN